MSKGKNQLERILEIDRKVRAGRYPDKRSFAKHFGVSDKSIERDFEFMRDRLGAPLEYDFAERGYFYSEASYFLPGDMLDDGEVFALLMSQQIISSMGHSPITDGLAESCRILSKYLPGELMAKFDLSLSRFTIISEPSAIVDRGTWELILSSLREDRRLYFEYKKSASGSAHLPKEIFPYHIVSWRGSWYVIGQNPQEDLVETYAICRMRKVKLGLKFPWPAGFDVGKYVDSEFGLYVDSAMCRISVRFTDWCAPFIRERKWHCTQNIEELDDGGLIFRFTTNQLETARQWVLRWGNGAWVLDPPELVEAMRKTVREMAEHYGSLSK